jgi:ElaB/YqjD/DUF883 family membrane-anchored ribosome-binding protein
MQNEAADIVQEHMDEIPEWKSKAKAAGSAAMDATKAAYQQIQDRTMAYSKATDQAIRQSPYKAVGIAFGAGLLLALLLTGGKSKECED